MNDRKSRKRKSDYRVGGRALHIFWCLCTSRRRLQLESLGVVVGALFCCFLSVLQCLSENAEEKLAKSRSELCFVFFNPTISDGRRRGKIDKCDFYSPLTNRNPGLFLLPDLVEVGGAAVQSGSNCYKVSQHEFPITLCRCVWCAAGVHDWMESQEEIFRLSRLHWLSAYISKTCVYQCCCCSLCAVCTGRHTRAHTQLMTYPKPRPARILFESQVWRVQLRCTNAA